MADNKAKRSQWYTFLNTGTTETPVWVREGRFASEMLISGIKFSSQN